MPELYLHKRRIDSVFSLLGEKENDITFSLGWAFSRSPAFLENFLQEVLQKPRVAIDQVKVGLQNFRKLEGITDIEISEANLHVIIEAKRGWSLPTLNQMKLYVPRFRETKAHQQLMVTMSECSDAYAQEFLFPKVDGIPVRHVSWSKISSLSHLRRGSHAEKRLMEELRTYLATIVNMQKQESNWVYVVSLGTFEWVPGLNFIQVVEQRERYFHPYGTGGWPKEPPNYIGFRYHGRLQSIHHVDNAQVIRNFHPYFPEAADKETEPFFLYKLGPPIRPAHEVKNGKVVRNARRRAMLDLLLTSNTISAACDASVNRVTQI